MGMWLARVHQQSARETGPVSPRAGTSIPLDQKEIDMASSALTHHYPSRLLAAGPLWRLHEEMDRLFDDVFQGYGGLGMPAPAGSLATMPRVDVHETENELSISAELPGMQAADLDLRLDGDVLTISGEKKSERDEKDDKGVHLRERSYGRFSRSMQLPFAPKSESEIKADFKDGVLTLHVPKQGEAQQSRRIQIGSGDGEQSAKAGSKSAAAGGKAGGSSAGSH
jgi:HSP20 family protein